MRALHIATGLAASLLGLTGIVAIVVKMAGGQVEHGPQALVGCVVLALCGAGLLCGGSD